MLPDSRALLADALTAAIAVEGFTRGKDLPDLSSDAMLRSAVYWQFAVIGEALSKLRQSDSSVFDRITESPRIVAFRNQIIHGYQVVKDNVTWQIIKDKLPVLRRELEQLLSE